MPRLAKPLSETKIKTAKPKTATYHLSDGGGLSLKVWPTGKKVWSFRYQRPSTGKTVVVNKNWTVN
jgi:hypothetical protein